MSTDLIPAADDTYTLGNSSTRWKELYVSDIIKLSALDATKLVGTNGSKQFMSVAYSDAPDALTIVSRDLNGNSDFNTVTTPLILSPADEDISIQSSGQAHVKFAAPSGYAISSSINGSDVLAVEEGKVTVQGDLKANSLGSALLIAPDGEGLYLASTGLADVSLYAGSGQHITSTVGSTTTLNVEEGASTFQGTVSVTGAADLQSDVTIGGGLYLPTSGGTAAALNAYETGSLSNNWGGAISSTSGPISFSKVGKSVTIAWAELSHLGNGSSTAIASTSGVIPSRMRPVVDIERIAMVQNNGTWSVGHVRVLMSGTIQFFASNPSGSFNGSGQHYIPGECFSYPTS